MSLCRLAGVQLNGHCLIPEFDPVTMLTNVPGIYVAGTAVGGTQQEYHVFLENCHVHIERIVAHITGSSLQTDEPIFEQPES
jgi:thioredoxin reductase (NADPH)